ncbi:sensor histidine kinase [Dyadobacter pollutisoli]|uniref:Histidine kinase n=1 Tax=Dyadobacter pollutisoli TaxID=2910158 RepID=A0A9E8SPA4_9BACT|nr:sensor histidine kinase [Dyadobacter pollutisoli]WAC14521.1 histidine kinase [Dyadobacter pollutisoli]
MGHLIVQFALVTHFHSKCIPVVFLRQLKIGVVVLLMTAKQSCLAQLPDFNVQLLDESNGIQTTDISTLVRDKQGFLWMMSSRHLQRFDGQNVKRIETEGEDLTDVTADTSGTIWTVTDSEIRRYVNDLKGFEKIKTIGPKIERLNKLYKLHVTPDNRVWANAGKGLYCYDPAKNAFIFHPLPGLEKHYFYRRIFSQRSHQLYLGDVHTIFCYNTRTRKVRSAPFKNVKSVVPITDDIAWVTDSRLQTHEINFATGTVSNVHGKDQHRASVFPAASLISVIPFKSNTYLVNTTKGCYLFDRETGVLKKALINDSGKQLPNDENYADFYDKEGTQWILCQEGIMFFRPLEHNIGWLRGFSHVEKGWSNIVRAITEDDRGNVWLGTASGLSSMNLASGQMKSVDPKAVTRQLFPGGAIRGLIFDGKNLIVGPETGRPFIFDPVRETFMDVQYPAGEEGQNLKAKLDTELIATIYPLISGHFLVVGEMSCYLLEKGTYRISERNFKGAENNIQAVKEDKNGNFWMGSYRGLMYVDKDFKTHFQDAAFSPGYLVSSVLIRNDSTVWCGSVGLYEVVRSKNKLKRRLIFPELRNQRITVLHQDKGGRIWIGGDDGLYHLNVKGNKLEWFDIWDNIQNKRLNANSLLESRSGYLFIGGFNGLNYFDPEKIESREEKLNVSITAVRINQDDSLFMLKQAPLQLSWKQNSFEFQFVTAYFRNPQKLIYRYRLVGLDNGWTLNGRNNRVRFSALPPGEYTFTVAASLDGVTWHETPRPFSFEIMRPFWKQLWFIALCVVVAGVLGYWLFKRRVTAIRRQTALREQVAEMEMKALRAQMNPHFIFNCLNSINRYIVKSDNATASLYLTRFSKLIRLILDNSNSKKVLLSNELEALKLYIEMERIRFDEKFEYHINLGEEVNADSVEVPSLIIQPYVENAIWHGLLHKETSGSLWVHVNMLDDNMLECVVEDNGIGREKARDFRSKSATSKKSLGMKLTEDRIAVLNQYAQTSASVEIIDLVDGDHKAAGTRVVIKIPV